MENHMETKMEHAMETSIPVSFIAESKVSAN